MQSGRIDPTPMTTHRSGFHNIETAFDMMTSKQERIINPLINL